MTALLVGGMAAAMVWMPVDWPGTVLWPLRIGFTMLALFGLAAAICSLVPRRDEAVDRLRAFTAGDHFDQDGFAFVTTILEEDELAYVQVVFQNQRDCKTIGRVVMKPVGPAFLETDFCAVLFEIACAPGAFGIARLPIAVPFEEQGEYHPWQVAASVEFPAGKGGLLRFGRGRAVGHLVSISPEDKVDQSAPIVARLLQEPPMMGFPCRVELLMPKGVLPKLPPGVEPEIKSLRRFSPKS